MHADPRRGTGTSTKPKKSRLRRLLPFSISPVRPFPPASLPRILLTFFPLTDAIITDPRGFHIPKGKSDKLPLSEKLRIQLSCDAKILEIDQFIRADVVPKDVIDYFDEQVKKEGWQKCVF